MTAAHNQPSAAPQISEDALRTMLLAVLKIGRLRARKAIVDIDFVSVGLEDGLYTAEQAIEILAGDGALAFTRLDNEGAE